MRQNIVFNYDFGSVVVKPNGHLYMTTSVKNWSSNTSCNGNRSVSEGRTFSMDPEKVYAFYKSVQKWHETEAKEWEARALLAKEDIEKLIKMETVEDNKPINIITLANRILEATRED